MKRIVCWFLAVMVFAQILSGCGRVESPVEDFEYEIVNGEITITGYLGTDREILIPEEICDRPVTIIGEKAFEGYDLVSVYFPDSLRIIDEKAFSNCVCLEKIVFPAELKRIEDFAFERCDSLTEVRIPNELEFLGWESFGSCEGLKELAIPAQFTGFDIRQGYIDYQGQIICPYYIWEPVTGDTVLVIEENSEAHRTILEYGYDLVEYKTIMGDKSEDSKSVLDVIDEIIPERESTLYLPVTIDEYDLNGVHTHNTVYTYDDRGRLIKEECDRGVLEKIWNDEYEIFEFIVGQVDGVIDQIREYTYDDKGNMLTLSYSNAEANASPYFREYEYEYSDRMVTRHYYQDYVEYTYSESGLLNTETSYRREYVKPTISKFEYDEQGKLLSIIREAADLNGVYSLDAEAQFVYNNDGYLIEIYRWKENKTRLYRYEFFYDKNGNMLTMRKYNSDDVPEEECTYVYDNKGNIVEKRMLDGTVLKYSYIKISLPKDYIEELTYRKTMEYLRELAAIKQSE